MWSRTSGEQQHHKIVVGATPASNLVGYDLLKASSSLHGESDQGILPAR